MWMLQTLHLPANKMISWPFNRFRGQWLLSFIMEGGNFGFYKPKRDDNMVRAEGTTNQGL